MQDMAVYERITFLHILQEVRGIGKTCNQLFRRPCVRYVDITNRAPESRREKVREDSGVFLRDSHGPRRDPRREWYGKFAGILQGEIRQRMSRVRILMIVACEGTLRSRVVRDP